MVSIENGEVVILVLLDLSAAFDTVDLGILITRLQNNFGITGMALDWIRSYLSVRKQSVLIKDCKSASTLLKYGVPQGWVH